MTLTEVKAALGVTDSSQDTELTRLMGVAQKFIENYTKRVFASATYTETYRGSGTAYLNLNRQPVTALTSVEYNSGLVGDPSWTLVDNDFCKLVGDRIYFAGRFAKIEGFYKVVYTAGEAMPDDIEQAFVMIINYYLKNQTSAGLKSESLGEASYTKDTTTGNLIKDLGLKAILDFYREPTL